MDYRNSKFKTKKVLVLHSGGIDSTGCISYYLKNGFEVKTLFVNYGQKSAPNELQSVLKVGLYYRKSNCENRRNTQIIW